MASYNYLISKQELNAYQQGYQPEVQASKQVSEASVCPFILLLLLQEWASLNLDKNVKDYNDLISNTNYYSDKGANESQQASSNPNIDYSKEAQLIIILI